MHGDPEANRALLLACAIALALVVAGALAGAAFDAAGDGDAPEAGSRRDAPGRPYPPNAREEFVERCVAETPADGGVCGCVFDRLRRRFSYERFRRLIARVDLESGRAPPEVERAARACL